MYVAVNLVFLLLYNMKSAKFYTLSDAIVESDEYPYLSFLGDCLF